MTHYIGATGLDIFEDAISIAIEETTNTLTTLIITQDNLQAGYTSNYVLSTSNILVERITDEIDFTSNYVLSTSNILIGRISDTSNYVLSTSNILVERTKQLEDRVDDLEGTEGSAGDPDADPPIPPIPPTGNFAILATLATLTAGATALAIVVADLTDDVNNLDDKVDLNNIYTSNYVKITSNILVKRITDEVGFGSNYVLNTSNILVKRITDEVGYTSNYVARINTALSGADYWTKDAGTNIYLNQTGNVGIGTQTSLTNKLQVQGTISASGLITGNAGLTIPSGQTLTSSGTLTASVINASGLITANAGLTISGVAQSLISEGTITARIINASGLITGNAGLTIPLGQTLTSSGTLIATTIIANELITANAGLTIASSQTLTSGVINASGLITATQTTTGTNDVLNMRYNSTNGIRFTQRYIGTNDVRYDLIQKVANVDKTASITLYNGNVGIGRTDPTNILQIGSGNRLRIANNNSDFTIIGTGDTPELHTRIFMGGINYTEPFYGGTGNLYMFSGNGGKHLFITQTTTTETERMRIGNNGNVAIGTTDTSTYKLNVAGDINVSGAFRVGGTAIANSWSAGTPSTNIYYNLGNVGIGTTSTANANVKLQVGGGGALRIANNVTDFTLIGTDDTDSQYNTRILLSGNNRPPNYGRIEYQATTGDHIFYTTYNTTERMRIASNGNVAIGTSSLVERLNVAGSISLGTYNTHSGSRYVGHHNSAGGNDCLTGMEIESTTLTGYYSQKLHFRTHWYGTNHGRRLTIHEDGRIQTTSYLGIGQYPYYSLDIAGGLVAPIGYDLYLRYFDVNNALGYGYTTLNNVSARIAGAIWCGSWITSSSDMRIKEDIQDINDDTALNMILAIEPKTYKYIDKVARGNKKVYGFIAQQIKEVLPDAVSLQPEYIPNIMLLADYDNEIITLPSQPVKVVIKLNDKIKCYDKDNKNYNVEVIEIIDELTFKIKFNDNEPIKATEPISNSSNIYIPDSPKYTDDKIFVCGTEVDDFHTISKEYIFTLNVCATQELHRRIISQEERIKELERKMTQILNYISI